MRAFLTVIICSVSVALGAQTGAPLITSQDLLDGLKDPTRWLTYGGDYSSHRHSPLTQITPENVNQLTAQWTFQTGTTGSFQTTPLVVDGVLYVTGYNNNAWAIDARSGRQIWRYRREIPEDWKGCCGAVNRGFAVLGDRLYMTTIDAHLLALDMRTGGVLYDVELIIHNVLSSVRLLADASESFDTHCARGIEPDRERIRSLVERSLMLVTALAPRLGYDRAAQIAKKAHAEGLTLKEAAVGLGYLTAEEFDREVRPEKMVG